MIILAKTPDIFFADDGEVAPAGEHLNKAGWLVMVEGLAAVDVTQGADSRELTVTTTLTSGLKAASTFRIP